MGTKDILILAVVGIGAYLILSKRPAATQPPPNFTAYPGAGANTTSGSNVKDDFIAAMGAVTAAAGTITAAINSQTSTT